MVFKHASSVLATGITGTNALAELGCPPSKLVNLPFFVPLPPVASRELGTPTERRREVVFATCGQLIRRKGYDILISALGQLRDAYNHFRLVLIGDGPERDALKQLAAGTGLAKHIEFAGWKETEDIQSLYSKVDAFIHPALSDAFPVAVLEAMAAGLTILGSDASGSVVDRVAHGTNGFVHRAGNITELSKHCAVLLANPALCVTMGARSRRVAEEWPVARGVEIIHKAITAALRNS